MINGSMLWCLARVIQLGVVRQLGSNSETLREEGDRTEGEACRLGREEVAQMMMR